MLHGRLLCYLKKNISFSISTRLHHMVVNNNPSDVLQPCFFVIRTHKVGIDKRNPFDDETRLEIYFFLLWGLFFT